jgi:PhnB protein
VVSPIPKGYRTVTPYLVAQDGPALLEFSKQAFGAEEMFRAVGTAGGVHGEVRIGDSMLMMGGGIPGREFRSTPNTHALHLYVPDCDAVYKRALQAGATSLDEPRDQEYGERSGSVKESGGELLVHRYAPGRDLHSEGTEQRQCVYASTACGAGYQLPEAGPWSAGDRKIRIARRGGSPR